MSHCVRIAGSGETFMVGPEESVLAAALSANLNLAHDCKSGTCGTCRVKLVEGQISYREEPMGLLPEEAEAGYALACQARLLTDLVIEAEVQPALAAEPARHRASGLRDQAAQPRRHAALTGTARAQLVQLPSRPARQHPDGGRAAAQLLDGLGAQEQPLRPAYPEDSRRRFHRRPAPGIGGGENLDVELPLGSFFLRKEDFRPLLMVATGTGLAPIKSILESLMEEPDDCPPSLLYWGTREPDGLYLHDDLATWSERLPEFEYRPVLSRGGLDWDGRRGHVQDAVLSDIEDLSEYAIYLCGSPEMVASAKASFIQNGASLNHIYTDSFLFQHNR